jgi:PPOX class probable FMN-dependent enzyme
MTIIRTIDELPKIYGHPKENSLRKATSFIIPEYEAHIRASPFLALATSGRDGLDCSLRGGAPGFVHIEDARTLVLPDWRGNNRLDSLENILIDNRVGLCFLVPGSGITLRVNGRAEISVDTDRYNSFSGSNNKPHSVIVIHVDAVYFQCSRAIMRSELWVNERHIDPKDLPSAGEMLRATLKGSFDAESYDQNWLERATKTLW